MKKNESEELDERIVPMSFIRQGRNFGSYEMNSFPRADLILVEDGAYKLRVRAGKENLVLGGSKGGEPRTWRSVERALLFIKKHFGIVRMICLIDSTEIEKV